MTEGDESVERILHSLKILSLLHSGDRLGEAQGHLCVHPPALSTSVGRWLKGNCRHKDIQHVSDIFTDAFAKASHFVLLQQQQRGARTTAGHSVLRLYQAITAALSSLRQLGLTYMGDVNAAAQLGVLRDKTQDRAERLARWLRHEGLLEAEQRGGDWEEDWVVDDDPRPPEVGSSCAREVSATLEGE